MGRIISRHEASFSPLAISNLEVWHDFSDDTLQDYEIGTDYFRVSRDKKDPSNPDKEWTYSGSSWFKTSWNGLTAVRSTINGRANMLQNFGYSFTNGGYTYYIAYVRSSTAYNRNHLQTLGAVTGGTLFSQNANASSNILHQISGSSPYDWQNTPNPVSSNVTLIGSKYSTFTAFPQLTKFVPMSSSGGFYTLFGNLLEVLAFDGTITPDQEIQVQNYLKTKWNG